VSNAMNPKLRPWSGVMEVVVLLELNVAELVLVVPDVAPGTIPETQFVDVCHALLPADELHMPLAANARELLPANANASADTTMIEPGTIRRRPVMPVTTTKRCGADINSLRISSEEAQSHPMSMLKRTRVERKKIPE
jgi:hypothetical protein